MVEKLKAQPWLVFTMVEKLKEELTRVLEILDTMDVEICNCQRANTALGPIDWEHVVEDDVIDQLHDAQEIIADLLHGDE